MLRIIAALLIASFALAACNTMEGAGEDIQKGGQKLENAADRNK
ncbi:MAG TPA: entericidin A/B family lipoprotein [Burkholderiales bacterium]